MFAVCSPAWLTQPPTSWPMLAGSICVRSISDVSTSLSKSDGWMPLRSPPRRPTGDRTASTMTMSSECGVTDVLLMAGTVLATLHSPPNGLPGIGPSLPSSGGIKVDFRGTCGSGQRRTCPGDTPQAFLTGRAGQPVGHPAGRHQPELRYEIKLFCHVPSVIRGCDTKTRRASRLAAARPTRCHRDSDRHGSLACAP